MRIDYKERVILTPGEMKLLDSAAGLLTELYVAFKSDKLEKISHDALIAIADLMSVCEQEG